MHLAHRVVCIGLLLLCRPYAIYGSPPIEVPSGAKVHFLGDSIFKGWGFGRYDHPSPLCRIQEICTLLMRDNPEAIRKIDRIAYPNGDDTIPGQLVAENISQGIIGLNDWIFYEDAGPHGNSYRAYRQRLADLAKTAAGANRRLMFMTMFDYEPKFPESGYDASTKDESTKTINDAIRDEAAAQQIAVIDMNQMMDTLQADLKSNGWGSTCFVDGVHPNVFGNWLMACVLLRSMGADLDQWKIKRVEKHFLHPDSGGDVPSLTDQPWGWPKDPSDRERVQLVRMIHRLSIDKNILISPSKR